MATPPSRTQRQTALEPLERESTPSMVASRIREAIAQGEISPGSQLGEVEYAAKLGVSRGPLREGLQRLTQEGLLVSHRNRGLFVIEMTDERVRDLYLARSAIERAAAAQTHQGNAQLTATRLLEVVDEMAEAKGDVRAVSMADIRFHQVLVEQAGSPQLSRIHETLMTETRMCIHRMEPTYVSAEARVGEHRQIADSLAAGDPAATDLLLMRHMRDAVQRLTGSPKIAGAPSASILG